MDRLSRRHRNVSRGLALVVFLLAARPMAAQTTVVVNPRTLSFQPSADHSTLLSDGRPAVDHYSFDVYAVGAAQPFQSTNIGKPAPAADGFVYYDFSASVAGWPLPGGSYEARVVAVGPAGSAASAPSNPFTFSSCAYALSGTSASLPASGGGTQVSVATQAGCTWSASSSASWVALSTSFGTGSGTVVATVAANTSTSARTATLTVAGQAFTIGQAGAVAPAPSPTPTPAPSPAPSPAPLPSPWRNQDVGTVGLAGSASASSGIFTVTGSGADIWGTADAFHYVNQPVTGNVEIVARMRGEQNTHPYAKAGVMLREGLTAASAHVILDVVPGGGVELMTRSASGATTTYLAGATQAPPSWLKLSRIGNVVSGAVSADGVTWRSVGSATVTMASSGYAGLAVTSHSTSLLNTATFDAVALTPLGATGLPSGWSSQDLGSVGLAGSASYAAGRFTVSGAGADIWGAADSFRFTYRSLPGDGQIVARVVGLQNTNAYAKAGVMLRGGLTAGAPHVILDLLPNGSIEFMTRSVSGGSTTYLGGTTQAAPCWVRLARAGSTVTASVSADGATWRTVGTTAVGFGAAYVGLAVTSHDTTLRNAAAFDGVTVR
jgi:regulation of enolase protein 1 (concanavalin A-like superfamily)